MSAQGARVIDLEEYRRKRAARSAELAPPMAPPMVWYAMPVWFWIPVWTTR